MANEEEMESFDITDKDLHDAFQPGGRLRRLTKDQQIYGVFNYEGDDEPSSSTFRFGSSTAKRNKGKDYTTPVGFVKGGVQGGSKKNAATEKKPKLVSFSESDDGEEGDEVQNEKDEEILQSLHNSGKLKGNISTDTFKKGLSKSATTNASNLNQDRYFNQQRASSSGLGDWEKNTKGIGSKLLMKMGYQPGKGLGKSLQGRSQPVEAQVRKGRGAVGLYGAEHKNEQVNYVASDEEEEKVYKEKLAHWKKDVRVASSEGKKKKVNFLYRTSEEVIEEATKDGVHKMAREYSEISKAKVIDMTGREQRVLSGYTALGARKTAEPNDEEKNTAGINKDKFQLEKLAYNLDTIVDFCEHEIIQNAKELSYTKDQVTTLETEMKNLSSVVAKEATQIGILTAVLTSLEELDSKQSASLLDLDYLLKKFSFIEESYPDEYETCDLANIALTYLIPLTKSRLALFWRPFDSPSTDVDCRSTFQRWRPLLEFRFKPTSNARVLDTEPKGASNKKMDPYHGLVWHAWMPALRGLISQWSCKNANQMVDLLECWEPLLAEWIMENILDQLILPRIQKEVDMWNPLTDMVPIHSWIHPWLPRLGSKLEMVYPIIRQKMAQALVGWAPSDQSARLVFRTTFKHAMNA